MTASRIKPLATGQQHCYDVHGDPLPCAGSGQDAEFVTGQSRPDPRFILSSPDNDQKFPGVLDQLTGLEWTRNAAPFTFPLNLDEAREVCAGLNPPGTAPERAWRLPNRHELFSLLHFDTANPALAPDHPFENVASLAFWTSTPWARDPDYFWYVQLSGGRMFFHRRDSFAMVWPVRGNSGVLPVTGAAEAPLTGVQWPEPRFAVAENGPVQDLGTGLLWTPRANLGSPCLWSEALQRIETLNHDRHLGVDRWRLPSIRELESLTHAGHHDPALPPDHPFEQWQEAYWSSTTSAFETDWAMCLYLHKGAVGVGYKPGPEPFAVWPCADPAD
ncbi:Protein of unknown function [Paucidesulfovibrio gracilis DSM 16080]|uniref:Lcl C-terminal domain-containing protein n=1 Tax=Paucidesulfovibrio gracilis DSM 16080 TaxID=1121449 RepID=A0A1T4WA67_9BACT|nr:DUF1566 domain-containing protein [Paucidesulfovibrio gracilis]SKA73601.1 Protein of unknown function [Paucidesulfovibrio gracilis DSM 16080]